VTCHRQLTVVSGVGRVGVLTAVSSRQARQRHSTSLPLPTPRNSEPVNGQHLDCFNDEETVLQRDAMHSADYAVARCPSVCLSVPPSHAGIPLKQLSHTILFNNKRYGKIPTETPNGGVECRWDMKKSRFSANILPYLGNDTR